MVSINDTRSKALKQQFFQPSMEHSIKNEAPPPRLFFEQGKPITAESLFNLADILAYPPESKNDTELDKLCRTVGLAAGGGNFKLKNILKGLTLGHSTSYDKWDLEGFLSQELNVDCFQRRADKALNNLIDHIQLYYHQNKEKLR
ncbi:MAG: hypothetical protein VKJ06_00165 [Vampirovibrionales bacterium]|nr:hypothetical protein [Vampirovibrionales bacterium]